MNDFKYITWKNQDGIGILTLNRPKKHNALNFQMINELADRIEACQHDDSVKVIVLKGAGENFCAGGDLKGHPFLTDTNPENRKKYLRLNHRIPIGIRRVPQPVIGALQGLAGGAGMDLAMSCDLRIAASDARMGVLFTKMGLMPDMGGSFLLPSLVGTCRALELFFTGDIIDAQEAHRIGIVNRVVNNNELEEHVISFASRLAAGPLQSYRMNKMAVYKSIEHQFEKALENEVSGQCELINTLDVTEAVNAFKERRRPVFKGK